jgi:hypothetical protein
MFLEHFPEKPALALKGVYARLRGLRAGVDAGFPKKKKKMRRLLKRR